MSPLTPFPFNPVFGVPFVAGPIKFENVSLFDKPTKLVGVVLSGVVPIKLFALACASAPKLKLFDVANENGWLFVSADVDDLASSANEKPGLELPKMDDGVLSLVVFLFSLDGVDVDVASVGSIDITGVIVVDVGNLNENDDVGFVSVDDFDSLLAVPKMLAGGGFAPSFEPNDRPPNNGFDSADFSGVGADVNENGFTVASDFGTGVANEEFRLSPFVMLELSLLTLNMLAPPNIEVAAGLLSLAKPNEVAWLPKKLPDACDVFNPKLKLVDGCCVPNADGLNGGACINRVGLLSG